MIYKGNILYKAYNIEQKLLLKLFERYIILMIQKRTNVRWKKSNRQHVNASELAGMTPEGQLSYRFRYVWFSFPLPCDKSKSIH